MKIRLLILGGMLLIFSSAFLAEPSFNPGPGCSGGGCHILKTGAVTTTPLNNLQVSVQVNGVTAGKKVGGELVDSNNNVVDLINSTSSNPFILTAPQPGRYTVNAGYKNPYEYGTTMVDFTTTPIRIPTPSNTRSTFELYPNHPNPFNSETIIKFSLPKPARVEINVFDVNGKFIRLLGNRLFAAGIHSLRWDGRDSDGLAVASGIYLCQITSGEHRKVRAMILSR